VPAAEWVFRQIAADPSARLTAGIVGPGGTGKSTLLDEIATTYEKAGIALTRAGDGTFDTGLLDLGRAVLVDDAHWLDSQTLDTLRAHAAADDSRLIVAYRPSPRSAALSALAASVARSRPSIVVSHLDRAAVAARIADRLGTTPPDPLVELVHEQSGGLPVLVDAVAGALRNSGRFDPRHPQRFRRPDRVGISVESVDRLRHLVDGLEPAVHGLLEAMAVGAALDVELLGALLGVPPDELVQCAESALATGLVTEGGRIIPVVSNLVLRLMPKLRAREMQQRLAGLQLERGGSVLDVGRRLLDTGATGSRIAAILETAGDEALRQLPGVAADLFAGAVAAGCPAPRVAARRARAVALTGDLDDALRLADQAISEPTAPDRDAAVSVLAAVMAHRGLLARSAALSRRLPGGSALAVPALVGAGALADAVAALDASEADGDQLPSLQAEAETLMARGMIDSVSGSATSALSKLARAAALLEPAGPTVLLPDTPTALTALVALNRGELTVAEAALRHGVAAKLGGRPAQIRLGLLYGWLAMVRGDLRVAHRTLDRVTGVTRLEPREELFAAALATALARREDDAAALTSGWIRARDALVRQPVDLYGLQPLGELAVAAARLGESDRVVPHLHDAEVLLDGLGAPALWAVPLHWYRLHAAIAADDLGEAERHAAALGDAATSSPYAAVLAAGARSWLQVFAGRIDRKVVETTSRDLHTFGLAWEGAHLVGQAAARSSDRREMSALLACARILQDTTPEGTEATAPAAAAFLTAEGSSVADAASPAAPATMPIPRRPPAAAAAAAHGSLDREGPVLSERELEVSRLVLAGLTYKQIGQRLFISAKTVEHHVARIRQRLGASSRHELFGQLRAQLQEASPAAGA
jgi:DNA-binding CsgD family transcriptional regulator